MKPVLHKSIYYDRMFPGIVWLFSKLVAVLLFYLFLQIVKLHNVIQFKYVSVQSERKTTLAKDVTYLLSNILSISDNYG